MLDRFAKRLDQEDVQGVALAQANVLNLDEFPKDWSEYDLILTASMLEYLEERDLVRGLRQLKAQLKPNGHMILFATRENTLTRPLIGRWWDANLFKKDAIERALHEAGYKNIHFRSFPLSYIALHLWGFVIEAEV